MSNVHVNSWYPAAQSWTQEQDHFRAHRVRLFLEHGQAGLCDMEYLQHDESHLHVLREHHWWWRGTTGPLILSALGGYYALLARLDTLALSGQDTSAEAGGVRAQMYRAWQGLTDWERARALDFSAMLQWARGPQGRRQPW